MKTNVELTHSPKTDTILLGHRTATFATDEFSGDVTASGTTLRVHVKGIDGYVDIDITHAVRKAIGLLRAS